MFIGKPNLHTAKTGTCRNLEELMQAIDLLLGQSRVGRDLGTAQDTRVG